ncbi:hypothetical protein ACF13M_003265 [Clostridioides difficile]|nr:hypothetical protein [Clostridioides difficile]EKS6833368.1 hypothetical protein [Clostridioides difficile]MBY2253569.1 hypothetical protein [Clostridioides difficile]MCI2382106.1 hypothetical protein [Clostridioides difficile]HBE9957831.1 hypothetical protein [Clostridioides difficile]
MFYHPLRMLTCHLVNIKPIDGKDVKSFIFEFTYNLVSIKLTNIQATALMRSNFTYHIVNIKL